MECASVLLFMLIAIGHGSNSLQTPEQKYEIATEPRDEICDSLHSIGLKNYTDFDQLRQKSTAQIRFSQLDSEQKFLVNQGICQIKGKVKNGQYDDLIRFPISGGCLRGIVGVQDFSSKPIDENEIDSLATKIFDNGLNELILKATTNSIGLYVDKELSAVTGLTFSINENSGEDEFGGTTFTKLYIFQRFKEGFFLTGVLCAG